MKTELALGSSTNKPSESYTQKFWHHTKQILKGAAVLGGGLLAYSVARSLGSQSATAHNAIAISSTNIMPTADRIIQAFSADSIFDKHLSRRTLNQCLAFDEASVFKVNTYTVGAQGYCKPSLFSAMLN